ncbi:MAG TPA: 2-hydroxychromene-2-carboxylate isomerase [Paenirhodobacter sp.]
MPQIDYFFSVLSPWAYLAGNRLEEIAAKHGATVDYNPLDIMTLLDRTGGIRPVARHPNRLAYRDQELVRWSALTGRPLKVLPSQKTAPNPAPASYAILAAKQAGGGDLGGLVQSFLAANWAENLDIADEALIREKLTLAGFDPDLATTGLFIGAMAYERVLDEAVQRGVFGVPFYIARDTDQRFWGQDRLDLLDAHLGAQ